jgi:hypothetical protein
MPGSAGTSGGGRGNTGGSSYPGSGGSSSGNNTANSSPTLPNGLPNYGAIPNTSSGNAPVPTDDTGAIDVWNMPSFLQGKMIWFDTGHVAASRRTSVHPSHSPDLPGTTTESVLTKAHSKLINMTAEQVMKQFAAMSQNDPMAFAAIQKELQDGGFYGSATHVYGGWNGQTETAVADAMTQYVKVAQAGGVAENFRTFLDHQAQANTGINGNDPGGAGGGGAAARQTILDDPEALKSAAMTAAQAALGSGLSEDQLNKFVAQFQGAQASYQQSTNSTVVQPDATSDAMAFAQKSDPQGYANHQATGYMSALMNLFLPSQDARPTITPVASV